MSAKEVDTAEFYESLVVRAKDRRERGEFCPTSLMVRIRKGFNAPHAANIMNLYWNHLACTNSELYDRLDASTNEMSSRDILEGRVQTAFYRGTRATAVDTGIFDMEFLEIMDAYIEYTDALL